MNKYHTKKRHHPRYASEPSSVLRHFLLVMLIIFFFGAGYFVHLYKQKPEKYASFNGYLANAKTWLSERNHRIQQGVQQHVKKITAKNAEEQPIHFEFYTTLPKVQLADSLQNKEPTSLLDTKQNERSVVKTIAKASEANQPAEKIVITNADSLEKDLFAQIEQTKKR